MQSILEDLWTKIDDRQEHVLSLHAAYMQQVAKSVSRGFDLLFGHKLFSFRFLGVSISYSVSSVALAFILAFFYGAPVAEVAYPSENLPAFALPGCILLVYLVIGTIPVLFPGFRFIKTWFLFILASACLFWVLCFGPPLSSLSRELKDLASSGFPALVACFGCDMLFIATTRQCLRWAGEMRQSYKIVVLVLLNIVFGAGLVLAPFIWALKTSVGEMFSDEIGLAILGRASFAGHEHVLPLHVVLAVSASNMIDLLVASVFVLLAALLLIHRVLWPLLNRSIFRFQEIGTKGRRAILVSAGLMLVGAGASDTALEWVKKVSEIFKS